MRLTGSQKRPCVSPPLYGYSLVQISLTAGKSKKIKATLKYKKKVSIHRKVAWESDNINVATVKNGKIKAVGKGTCYVYAYAQNGVSAKIKVTVK